MNKVMGLLQWEIFGLSFSIMVYAIITYYIDLRRWLKEREKSRLGIE